MEGSGQAPTAVLPAGSGRLGRREPRSGKGGASAAAAERLCCKTASRYICAFARVCIQVVSECAPTRGAASTSPSLAGWLVEDGERGTGAATAIICLGRDSDPTCALPTDRDFLACLARLALWPSWSDTGGPPSSLRQASSRARPEPRGQTKWPPALSELDGLSGTITRLPLFSWIASSVVTQTQTLTHSMFHSQASRREAKLCSITGPQALIPFKTVDQTLPP